MNSTRMSIAVALCAGLVIGAAAGWRIADRGAPRWGGGKERYERLLKQFSRELTLTRDQQVQVGKILEEKRQKIEALRAEMRPRFEEIRRTTDTEIQALLSPAQQPRFKAIQASQEAERRKRWGPSHTP